jgi:ABC-type transport system involved in multi-copper enzyme maturation permease subunit
MNPILKYITLTAVRDRLYVGLFVILVAAFGISVLLGDTALSEGALMTIVYIAGSSRMIFAVGIILFVCFHIRRSFDNKEVEFILSKPISRHKFIFTYLTGFILVALMILLPIFIVLLIIATNKIGLIFWSLSVIFEMLIMITFSILAALILKSAVSAVLASLGFYVMSRMMGFFVLTIKLPDSAADINSFTRVMHALLKILSFVFPRLDLFAKSDWLIYGLSDYSSVIVVTAQSLIYIPLMISMAFYDFKRKQF